MVTNKATVKITVLYETLMYLDEREDKGFWI
jgi:hypothetical protein